MHHMPLYAKIKGLGIEHFYVELLEKVKCNDRIELNQKEGEWIRKIGTLNKNKHSGSGLSMKEYYYNNREDILKQKKYYYKQNKEKTNLFEGIHKKNRIQQNLLRYK